MEKIIDYIFGKCSPIKIEVIAISERAHEKLDRKPYTNLMI